MKTGFSLLDFKLSLRMLVRFPGLTIVGGLAIAFAVWVGAGAFEVVTQVIHPRLPLEEGARIVGLQNVNRANARAEAPALEDFATWKSELRTVRELGAFRLLERNLIAADGSGEPVEVAEISATGFSVARVPPLLGRHLVADDERGDAAPVAVIGYDVWRRRFGGDPAIVGRQIRLGREVHTVVGVMPRDFAFPVAQRLWVPLRLSPAAYAPGASPAVRVFGRLAPGASLEEAQAELAAVGRRVARDSPRTHDKLNPRVVSYAQSILNLPTVALVTLGSANVFLVMLIVLVCGNVALLMLARAASREGELVVRSALGASRARIIAQLFAEALVLAVAGAALGLAALQAGLDWAFGVLRSEFAHLPFWIRPSVTPLTLFYSLLLTLLAALVAGVVPGVKVTRGLGGQLRKGSAGGGGFRFGGIWTAVIVSQIALTLIFPVVAFVVDQDAAEYRDAELGIPERQYLSVRVEIDGAPGGAEFRARYAATVQRLEERLETEPEVESVTFGERLPRMYHPHLLIELDEGGGAPLNPAWPGYRVSNSSVSPDYFASFRAPVLAGRTFQPADTDPEARVVVVNQSFVELVLGGRNPIGRRFRAMYYEEWDEPVGTPRPPQPWYEIVGVVRDLGLSFDPTDPKRAGFYHPVAAGGAYPGHLALRVKGDAAAFAPRLRGIATRLEPDLRLYDIQPLDRANDAELKFISFWFWLTAGVGGVAMFLSLAGIYSVMAFTAAQRTREIGIRVALGGTAGGVVRSIFRRPLAQVGLGIAFGTALSSLLVAAGEGTSITLASMGWLALYVVGMTGVCLLACVVPTRRALRVEPTEALRAEG